MMDLSNRVHWTFGIVLGILHSFLIFYTNKSVPEPYMDEIFHIDQTRRFCSLNFSWNEKITTPPGLYILSLFGFCGRERYTNSLLIPLFYVGAVRFRKLFTEKELLKTALIVLSLPVLLHSTLLYYTDLLSVTLLLWGFSCSTSNIASLFFLFAILTRQTNVVWAGLYGAIRLVKRIKPELVSRSVVEAVIELWPLILLALSFISFFILNGYRVVLGDHHAHQPRPHFMQLYYYLAFTCLSAAPYLCLSNCLREPLKDLSKWPLRNVVFCIIIIGCIHSFTFEHPYTLADNRHFMFYIWRKWFRRHWSCRYIVAPCYLFAIYIMKYSVMHIERYISILFLLATAVVLIPLPLIEPRYFIVPFVMWRLSLAHKTNIALIVEILFNCFINISVLYLFFEKPFIWDNEPKALQRFMW